jgi:hypothetical protein
MFLNIKARNAILLAAFSYCILGSSAVFAGKSNKHESVVYCGFENFSVQKAINKVKHNRKVTIFIVGTCNERVTIEKDNISLSGNADGDGSIDGGITEIRVIGGRRINIEYLDISGAGNGVLVSDGATANITNNDIHNNQLDGIGVFNNSFVRVEFNSITGNGRPDPFFEAGINAGVGSTVRSRGNYIAYNGYAAVEIANQSYFRSGLFTSGAINPADKDIILQKGCSGGELAGTCGVLGTNAIECFKGGICDLRNTDVTGSTLISSMSTFDVRTSTINGSVDGSGGSLIRLRGSVTGSGSVNCYSEAIGQGVLCGGLIP